MDNQDKRILTWVSMKSVREAYTTDATLAPVIQCMVYYTEVANMTTVVLSISLCGMQRCHSAVATDKLSVTLRTRLHQRDRHTVLGS